MKIQNNMRCISLLILTLVIFGSLISTEPSQSQEKTLDDQVNEISHSLLCPVCQGQSVAESNSNLANDMRQVIRKKLQEGQSRDEIVAYFIETYGETILGAPPAKGVNWVLWILPGLAIVFGLFGIGIFLYQAESKKEKKSEVAEKTESKSDNIYLDKIDEELKRKET
jgi:cytochrome c-type biogenesis protein CcmH